uniref:Putative cytochrome n=1 Tax=Corethrella appendiculata TaxID=1370023 RepID=U5ELR8_9DIPT
MWLIILLLFALILSIYFFGQKKINDPVHIVGPPQLPILGNGLLFMNVGAVEILRQLQKLWHEYGSIYKIFLGSKLWIIVSDPKLIEEIATNPKFLTKSDDYDVMEEWLGRGLLTSSGQKWFTHRKALTPAFHFKILETFVPIFDAQSDILIRKLEAQSKSGKAFDIFPLIKLYALDVICETAMGTSCYAQLEDSAYAKAIEKISEILNWRVFHALAWNDLYFRMTRKYPEYKKQLQIIYNFTNSVIKSRKNNLGINNNEISTITKDEDIGMKKKMALLDILLQTEIDGKLLTNEEIREEVESFMFAGHDTTTSAITFLLYNLAKCPEIQEKVYMEISNIIGDDKTTKITLRHLNEMKYFDMVIKESLRMHSPVPFIARRIEDDLLLCDIPLQSGTNIALGIYLLHHDPKYFPEPEKFLPERFDINSESEKYANFSYIPFSAGSRNCIGQKFALNEIKSGASKVLRNFIVKLPQPDYEPIVKTEIVLKPANGVYLNFEKRV